MRRRNLLKGLLLAPLALLGRKSEAKAKHSCKDGFIGQPGGKVFPLNHWQFMELEAPCESNGSNLIFKVGQAKVTGPHGGHKEVIIGGDCELVIHFCGLPMKDVKVRYTDTASFNLDTKEDVRLAKEYLRRLPSVFAFTKDQANLCCTMAGNIHETDLPLDDPREPYAEMGEAQKIMDTLWHESYEEAVEKPFGEKMDAELQAWFDELDAEKGAAFVLDEEGHEITRDMIRPRS